MSPVASRSPTVQAWSRDLSCVSQSLLYARQRDITDDGLRSAGSACKDTVGRHDKDSEVCITSVYKTWG